jgi:hypothetical protein
VNGTTTHDGASITFPALSFNQGWLSVLDSTDSLRYASRLAVKRGDYRNTLLVDSNLNSFQIASIKKIRTLFGFRFGRLLAMLGGNPRWEVELTFGPPSRLSLDEAKRLISNCFAQHEDFWEEMCDFEEFRDSIAKADSLQQVFTIFREFHLF